MPTYNLKRICYGEKGTFGVLTDSNGKTLAVTLEDPNNNNQVGISCIPVGTYKCTPHNGTKYKNVWILNDVPNRTAILIHQGNTMRDTRGCILVGNSIGVVGGLPAVLNSVKTLDDLREILPENFTLTIEE